MEIKRQLPPSPACPDERVQMSDGRHQPDFSLAFRVPHPHRQDRFPSLSSESRSCSRTDMTDLIVLLSPSRPRL